ncbi:MAG: hypothetical protein U9M94_04485, partial [Patescibacteria group bacterium]|nr:hypothetical protein [Patescibacteria group bacterium]
EHFELIYLSKNSVLSFGGIDTLKHIAEISRNSSLLSDNSIFFCPDIPKNENFLDEYNKIILSSSENILDLIKPEYLVSPSSYVSGGDPTKDVWVNSSYRDDAQNRLLRQNIKSYQLALGGRYIYSYHRGVVDIPVDINQDEKYKILLRHIPNRIGGEVSVKINGSDYITSTISDRNEAKWSEIYEGKIELDTISISNIYGFNVIDVLAVIPLDEYNIFLNQIDDLMQDKEIDYLVRPAYDVNNYINVVDYKTDKLTISRSSEKFNIDSKELNKLLLTPKYFKNINIYPSINSNFFFFDEKSGELRYDIKGEQSITTNFMQFDLDVKDLSYYDGLNLKMHTNIPYEKISVVYSNGKEKKEWPFLERVNSKDEYTFLFGDRKRDSVDSIHIWLPCDRYQGSCNVKLSGIEFFRINSVLSKQINFIKSSTYELLTDLEYNKNSSNIVLSYDNQEIECKNVNGLVGFMLGHIDKGVHEIKLNLFDGQKIGTIYLHDLNTVKKDNMNIPKIESILKFKKAHKYKIIFDREVEKEVIVFSKEFNNFWVAIDDNGNKLKPKKVLGINNAFYIKNKTKTITIEFWLQRWFYLGLLISGMTFLGCVIYLIADFIKRRRRPKHKQFRNLFNFLKCFQKSKK